MEIKKTNRLYELERLEKQNSETYHIDNVMKSVKNAYLSGDIKLASALLARGSQYCEDAGLISISISMLALAERLLNE